MKSIKLTEKQARVIFDHVDEILRAELLEAYPNIIMSKEETKELDEWANNIKELAKLIHIHNKGWKPDWNDDNQRKYYMYLDMKNGTFNDWAYYCSFCYVPARLCFESKESMKEFYNKNQELIIKVFKK